MNKLLSSKICASCKIEKPIVEFTKDHRHKSGLDSYCRSCKVLKRKQVPREKQQAYQNQWRANNREHVNNKRRERYVSDPEKEIAKARKYREAHPERVKASRDKARQEKRDWITNYKVEQGCMNCGIKDPRVLDLHHKNGVLKEMAVARAVSRFGWTALRAEVKKCEVLCANCHRIFHYQLALKKPAAAT